MLNIHRHTDTEIAAGVLHLATMPDYPRRPRVGVILAIDDYGNVEMARTPFTMRSSWEKRHAEHIIGFYTASTRRATSPRTLPTCAVSARSSKP